MNRFSKIALSKTETLLALKWLYCTISSLIQRGVSRVCTSVVSPTKGVNSSAESFTTGCALLCGVVYYRLCAPSRCCLLQGVRSLRCRLHSGVYFSAVSPTLEGCFSAASSTVYRGALLRCVTYSAYEIQSRPPPQRSYSEHLAELLFTWMDLLFSRCWGFGGL